MDELQQLKSEIRKAQATSSIENLKLIQKLYASVVKEFNDADLEMKAQLIALKAEIDHFPTLLEDLKTGPKGEKGDPGEVGERGVPGKDGAPGRDGIDGKDGRDGTDGKDGKDGSNADLDGDEIITRINESEDIIDKERVEGLKEIEAKADMALSRPVSGAPAGGGGSSGVKDILSGTNTEVTRLNGKYTINALNDVTSVTSNYTLGTTDMTVVATSGSFVMTLPTAVGVSGKMYIMKNMGTGIVTVNTTSSQKIDGNDSGTVSFTQYEGITVQSDGANWMVTES